MLGVQTPFLLLPSATVRSPAEVTGMNKQSEPAVAQIGDRCHICGKGSLLRAPSGVNLICHACNRVMVLRRNWETDEVTSTTGLQRGSGRPMKLRLKKVPSAFFFICFSTSAIFFRSLKSHTPSILASTFRGGGEQLYLCKAALNFNGRICD